MATDFLSLLNETNSIKNEETGEITLTVPKFEADKSFTINSKYKITSNCNTLISGSNFAITSKSAFFQNISFETPITFENSEHISMINCNIKKIKYGYSLSFKNCKSIELVQIDITDSEVAAGIIFKNSEAVAKNLLIDGSTKVLIELDDSIIQLCDSNLKNSQFKGINILSSEFEIQNCSFSDTVYPAIYTWNSKGKILNSKISSIKLNGFVVNNSNFVEIRNNEITDVNGSAISVIDNSKCEICHNSISKIGKNGIFVKNNSKINAQDNTLDDIKYPAIAILMKSKAKLIENKISSINACGIRIMNAKKISIEKNEIKNIEECAISILNTKKSEITNNTISNCKIAGVEVYNQSKVNIFDNNLSKLGEFAFLAYTMGEIKAENNTISDVGKSMTKLIYKGGGEFINNKLDNCPQQKEGQTNSEYYFSGNGNFTGITNNASKKSESIQYEEQIIENSNLCIKCNKNDRKCFLLNCGHKIYCQECAKEALDNHQKCPLCRLPIDEINEGFVTENETCDICCEKKADCIVMPCGHIGYCHKCLNKWLQNKNSCPYCQIEPVTYKNIQDI